MGAEAPTQPYPRVVAWEVTRACPLACIHCRAEAMPFPDPSQLTTEEGKALLLDIALMNPRAIIILSGGEPLTRPDILELASYGTSQGLYMTASPDDGRLLTPGMASALKSAGVKRLSFSIHYPTAIEADSFARREGFWAAAMYGLANLRAADLPFQMNTTVTRRNAHLLPQLHDLALKVGAVGWDLFFLVPTGRARMMQSDEMPPEQYEDVMNWLFDLQRGSPIPIRQTCAPHFRRVERQRAKEGKVDYAQSSPLAQSDFSRRHSATSRGCMTGDGFCFVSHVGEVFGCGYLPIPVGNIRERPFSQIYRTAPVFLDLREPQLLKGKCGICEFKLVCGGCRARAYATTGDYLGEEPYCVYSPGQKQAKKKAGAR